ncbi:hypothetical protein [Rhizobium sp. BR 315]|uniref:hypothetical protein n=1 Tax=Rhizobium sp. BR 315 TaxID=3040014 RepID=UPI003D355927
MSLLNLLTLSDQDLDTVTAVVREWCETHQVSIDSDRGRTAMSEAVQICLSGERVGEIIADKLARNMRLIQFKQRNE